MKRWEITEEVLMNCNSFYLLRHANGQMHTYMTALSVKIFNKRYVFAIYQFKSVWLLGVYNKYATQVVISR